MSPYTDLDRPPLNEAGLRRALVVPDGVWTELRVVAETASTNADLVAAARDGAAEGLVLVAERQTAGRGRLGRAWASPPRAGLAVSVLLRPAADVPSVRLGWLPLLAGVALVEAVRRACDLDAVLKWPNDLLIGDRKCAGILAEAVPAGASPQSRAALPAGASPQSRAALPAGASPQSRAALPTASGVAVVIGLGLNTTLREPELPHPDATSLQLAGAACVDRDPLLRAVLRELATWYRKWRDAGGDAEVCGLAEAYRLHCATLGRQVRAQLPAERWLTGRAEAVDAAGRLVVVTTDGGREAVAAGDVVHLR